MIFVCLQAAFGLMLAIDANAFSALCFEKEIVVFHDSFQQLAPLDILCRIKEKDANACK